MEFFFEPVAVGRRKTGREPFESTASANSPKYRKNRRIAGQVVLFAAERRRRRDSRGPSRVGRRLRRRHTIRPRGPAPAGRGGPRASRRGVRDRDRQLPVSAKRSRVASAARLSRALEALRRQPQVGRPFVGLRQDVFDFGFEPAVGLEIDAQPFQQAPHQKRPYRRIVGFQFQSALQIGVGFGDLAALQLDFAPQRQGLRSRRRFWRAPHRFRIRACRAGERLRRSRALRNDGPADGNQVSRNVARQRAGPRQRRVRRAGRSWRLRR